MELGNREKGILKDWETIPHCKKHCLQRQKKLLLTFSVT